MIFGLFTLFVALCISAVAEFYSIIGLTAIFAAQPIPVIIMGVALGVGKITAAVWLKMNWHRASWTYKLYLVPAVAFLMLLTSMGIFGFLSKAHSDQSLVGGDVQAKISLYDEKIRIERENIANFQQLIKQMDAVVNGVIATGDQTVTLRDGTSQVRSAAERSLQIRRSQAKDRDALTNQIGESQDKIVKLQEEAAPIRAEVRKVEAEVGPIKYIAAIIYGDNSDANLLEAAVRWVIILIVAVFDPLALVLIVAAQQSLRWAKEEKFQQEEQDMYRADKITAVEPTETLSPAPPAEVIDPPEAAIPKAAPEPAVEKTIFEQHPYLNAGFGHFKDLKPMVWKPTAEPVVEQEHAPDPYIADVDKKPTAEFTEPVVLPDQVNSVIEPPAIPRYTVSEAGYVEVEGKSMHYSVLKDFYPDVYKDIERRKQELGLTAQADNLPVGARPSRATFGTEFPPNPEKGEMFLHVAIMPSRLHKYNGTRWIEVDKSSTDSYTYNEDYLRYLIVKINQGHILLDDLTEAEQDQIAEYLKKNV
jgi:hypothetical protein